MVKKQEKISGIKNIDNFNMLEPYEKTKFPRITKTYVLNRLKKV